MIAAALALHEDEFDRSAEKIISLARGITDDIDVSDDFNGVPPYEWVLSNDGLWRSYVEGRHGDIIVVSYGENGGEIPLHYHSRHRQVVTCLSGKCKGLVGNAPFVLRRRESIEIPANTVHSVDWCADTMYVSRFFDISLDR
jgi:quercetin dioxygenase-like cupin family protein